jgi:hypothetical protein
MKKIIALIIITGLTILFTFSQKIEIRSVSHFTRIDAAGIFEITVFKGNTESLTMETNEEFMPYVRGKVINGVLRLYYKDTPVELTERIKKIVKVTVVLKNLNQISLSGISKFITNDTLSSKKFKVDCSGNTIIMMNVNTEQLSIDASGKNKIQITANVIGKTKVDMSGSSEIDLSGSTKDFIMDISGSSCVKAENFITQTAAVKSSGKGNVALNVTDRLKIISSKQTSINYKKYPTLIVSKKNKY